jgi:hypothetical protein
MSAPASDSLHQGDIDVFLPRLRFLIENIYSVAVLAARARRRGGRVSRRHFITLLGGAAASDCGASGAGGNGRDQFPRSGISRIEKRELRS